MPSFDEQSTHRIIETARWVEGQPRNAPVATNGPRVLPYRKFGRVTTALTAMSGGTPGSGQVQPYLFTKTSVSAIGDPVQVFNWTGSTIAVGMTVSYGVFDGVLFVDGQDCGGNVLPNNPPPPPPSEASRSSTASQAAAMLTRRRGGR